MAEISPGKRLSCIVIILVFNPLSLLFSAKTLKLNYKKSWW